VTAEQAAFLAQAEEPRDVRQVGRRLVHAAHVRNQTGRVRQRRHLHLRLSPVAEGVVHLEVDGASLEHFGVEAKALWHSVGRPLPVVGVVHGAAPRRHDLEAKRASILDQVHGAAGLVAVHQGVDHAGAVGLAAQNGADGHIRLDVNHHHMFAPADGLVSYTGAHLRHAGRLHDHVH